MAILEFALSVSNFAAVATSTTLAFGMVGIFYIASAVCLYTAFDGYWRRDDTERASEGVTRDWMTRRGEDRDKWLKRWTESRKRWDEERDRWKKRVQDERRRLEICKRIMREERQLWTSVFTKELKVLFSIVSDETLSSSLKERVLHQIVECKCSSQGEESPPSSPPLPPKPSSPTCVVCLEETACIASVPCGHMCLCEECRGRLCKYSGGWEVGGGSLHLGCPMCRAPVDLFVRVFS